MPADMAYFAARVRWAGSRDLTGYIPAVICARKMAATACHCWPGPVPPGRVSCRQARAACSGMRYWHWPEQVAPSSPERASAHARSGGTRSRAAASATVRCLRAPGGRGCAWHTR